MAIRAVGGGPGNTAINSMRIYEGKIQEQQRFRRKMKAVLAIIPVDFEIFFETRPM